MISLSDAYHVVSATVPLYVTMILAYISVKWWKLFTPDQCSGINKFVAKFSIPLLSFQVISSNNVYKMSLKLIYADVVQKSLAFLALAAITRIGRGGGGLKWIVTGISLSTLPNTLILGIPLMKAMYKDESVAPLAQIIFLQSMVWYNFLLFLYELDAVANKSSMPPPSQEAPPPPPSQGTEETETSHEVVVQSKEEEEEEEKREPIRTKRKMKILLILITVWKKLIRNPNTFATLIGLIWSTIQFRWGVHMPKVVNQSIEILSNGGLGLFMASQSSIIACGPRMTMVAIGLKFLVGPALMAVASIAIGLRGTLLKVAIVQAALPQGIVPFVFAKEYNVHPAILSTAVILGMLIALPVALAYYFLLAL
ncbi:auxin efflux carrier component 8-like isoform X2 [Arachis ipaensis]|uniref:auxin efflux carrier component 8-like isoform X2 n=1 Tax=Arachis ipaensis TaxID=130454 RepID=UPI0007AFCDCF|nr:auxin efflux carrier component 8-like isoform X2 [Arachis ipaensis]XP_025649859.1 auxin efflux carrier component 8-like isoform X2 [Arachis hypogaea]